MTLDPHAALRSLLASGPSPRLTWFGGDGERLELSGRVVATWGSKIANLLVEEVDAGPGTRVLLDLPPHWRTLAWALGTWLTGATVVAPSTPPDDAAPAAPTVDVVVTTSPQDWEGSGADVVVAVALASFALRWPGDLPPGVLDGATDTAMYADSLGPVAAADPTATALELPTHVATFAALTGGEHALVDQVLALAAGDAIEIRG